MTRFLHIALFAQLLGFLLARRVALGQLVAGLGASRRTRWWRFGRWWSVFESSEAR